MSASTNSLVPSIKFMFQMHCNVVVTGKAINETEFLTEFLSIQHLPAALKLIEEAANSIC